MLLAGFFGAMIIGIAIFVPLYIVRVVTRGWTRSTARDDEKEGK